MTSKQKTWQEKLADKSLNEKFPGGLEAHKALLEEGFQILQKGSRFRVAGYQEFLFWDFVEVKL